MDFCYPPNPLCAGVHFHFCLSWDECCTCSNVQLLSWISLSVDFLHVSFGLYLFLCPVVTITLLPSRWTQDRMHSANVPYPFPFLSFHCLIARGMLFCPLVKLHDGDGLCQRFVESDVDRASGRYDSSLLMMSFVAYYDSVPYRITRFLDVTKNSKHSSLLWIIRLVHLDQSFYLPLAYFRGT